MIQWKPLGWSGTSKAQPRTRRKDFMAQKKGRSMPEVNCASRREGIVPPIRDGKHPHKQKRSEDVRSDLASNRLQHRGSVDVSILPSSALFIDFHWISLNSHNICNFTRDYDQVWVDVVLFHWCFTAFHWFSMIFISDYTEYKYGNRQP